jgi:hypothetical protein
MLNFYRRFLPHADAIQAPLHAVLSGPRVRGFHPILWTPELLQAFADCKDNLSRTTLLAHPDPTAPLAFSRKLNPGDIRSSLQIDLKLLSSPKK